MLDSRCDAGAFCYGFGWTLFYFFFKLRLAFKSHHWSVCICVLFEVVTFFLKVGGNACTFLETVKDFILMLFSKVLADFYFFCH